MTTDDHNEQSNDKSEMARYGVAQGLENGQFSLRTLFIVTAYCAGLMGLIVARIDFGVFVALSVAGVFLVRAGRRLNESAPPRGSGAAQGSAACAWLGLLLIGAAPGTLLLSLPEIGAPDVYLFLLGGPGIVGLCLSCWPVVVEEHELILLYVLLFSLPLISHALFAIIFVRRCLDNHPRQRGAPIRARLVEGEWKIWIGAYFAICLIMTALTWTALRMLMSV